MLAAVVNTDFQRHQIIQAGIQAFDQLTMVLGLIGRFSSSSGSFSTS